MFALFNSEAYARFIGCANWRLG